MSNRRLPGFKILIIQVIFLVVCGSLIAALSGCEAFSRKFTRKSKKPKVREEIVLVPEDYSSSDIPVEQRYREYFVFWKSWQEELIVNLEDTSSSYKKRKSCIHEAIKNLVNLRTFLFEEKQKDLDSYLAQLQRLQAEIKRDIYGSNLDRHRNKAENLKRNIIRDLSYSKVKAHLR
ncbi:hypothetical protein ACFL4C_04310 [Candidatus Omnitrophota bacterium]